MAFGRMGARGRFGGLGAGAKTPATTFDFFVNSATGSDSNNGTSSATPYATLSKLLTNSLTGKRIGIAKGSTFNEECAITANNVTIDTYGSGAIPLFDGGGTITNGSFTLTAGKSLTYQATISFPNSGTEFRSALENDRFLAAQTSIANVEATAGSFFWDVNSGTGSKTLYVHAYDGSNVSSNGKTYVYTKILDVMSFAGTGNTIKNIRLRRARNNNGPLNFGGSGAGSGQTISGCTIEDGGKHSVLVGDGSTITGCTFINAYNGPTGAPNLVVFNQDTPAGVGSTVTNNTFTVDTTKMPAGMGSTDYPSGIIAHANTSGSFGTLTSSGNTFTKTAAAFAGLQDFTALSSTNDTIVNANGIGSAGTKGSFVATFSGLHFTMSALLNDASAARVDGFTATPVSGRATVTYTNPVFDLSGGTYDMKHFGSTNTDYVITGGSVTGGDVSSRFPQGLLLWTSGSGNTLALNTTTLKIAANGDPFLNLETDLVYSGNNNTFDHNGAGSRSWAVNNSGIASSLATWQAYTNTGLYGAHDGASTSP